MKTLNLAKSLPSTTFRKSGRKGLPSTTFRKSGAGFTLLETIIAIFILSVGILAVLVMFPLGIQVAKSSKMNTVATQLAQAKIEEIISKSYSYSEIVSEPEQTLDFPFSAYKRETAVTHFDPDNPDVTPGEDIGIKKIEVTVSWGTSPSKKIELVTLIAKR